MENNCGRHRNWHCIQCNLLTEDAYREHMETHGQPKSVFVKSDVVETFIENEISNVIEDVADDNNCIETNIEDPLLWMPNEEKYVIADTGENPIAVECVLEDSLEFTSDEK